MTVGLTLYLVRSHKMMPQGKHDETKVLFLDFYHIFSIPVNGFFTAGTFYFTAIHQEIKWKKDLMAFFLMEKCFLQRKAFSVWKMGFFHTEKGLLQRKAFSTPLEVNCSEQCPTAEEGVAPAIAGDLLIRFQN